jgi:hypothetical protein
MITIFTQAEFINNKETPITLLLRLTSNPLSITFSDNLLRYSFRRAMEGSIVCRHISVSSSRQRKSADNLHVDLRMTNPNERQCKMRATMKVLANKMICGFPILESL